MFYFVFGLVGIKQGYGDEIVFGYFKVFFYLGSSVMKIYYYIEDEVEVVVAMIIGKSVGKNVVVWVYWLNLDFCYNKILRKFQYCFLLFYNIDFMIVLGRKKGRQGGREGRSIGFFQQIIG